MKQLSLKQRLFVVTGLALLPAVAVVISSVIVLDQARQREVRAEALRSAELVSLEIERIISGTESLLATVAAAPEAVREDSDACEGFLKRMVQELPALASIAIVRPDGQVRCLPDLPETGLYLGDRSYILEAIKASSRITGVYIKDRATGKSVLPIAWPHRDSSGALIEVIVGYIDLIWLQTLVERRTHLPGSSLTIADRDGRILARHPMPERFVGTVIPEEYQRLVNAAVPGNEAVISQDGTHRIIGYVPVTVPPRGIYVSTGVATDTAFSIVTTLATSGILISILGLLLSFWLADYVGRKFISRPFENLLKTVELWRRGDTTARSGMTESDGEIGVVGVKLDTFMDELLAARSERERLEVQRREISRELDHRVKNLLAMVQAVARQTLAGSTRPDDLAKFNDRLKAIGTANTLLMEEKWQTAKLREVIESGIAPFRNKDGSNFRLDGPAVHCNSNACVVIGMALHELCTNAAKYGALSVPGGLVHLTWSATGDEFRMLWKEEGGPEVKPPSRSGFGSTMIDRVLGPQLGGRVKVSFNAEGLTCVLRCPLAAVVQAPAAA